MITQLLHKTCTARVGEALPQDYILSENAPTVLFWPSTKQLIVGNSSKSFIYFLLTVSNKLLEWDIW
jgi:hypothetical protein